MSLDQRLTQAARHLADGLVPPVVDLEAVRTQARHNQRRTTTLAVVASVLAVVVVAATAAGGRATGLPDPTPVTPPTPSASASPSRAWTPDAMTPEAVVGSSAAQLETVGVVPSDTDVRLSIWKTAGYRGMALTTNGYRTVTYAAVPAGVTRLIGSPKDGVFLLSDGSDHEWLVDVVGTVRPVKRVSSAFTPADPRLWFQCVHGSWRSRWCSLDLTTSTAHVSSAKWGGSAVRPGLGVEPWGAHPEPRAASTTGRLEAWWYTARGRQVHTVAQARDGDYVLGTAPGEMALWAPGGKSGTVDLHTSRDGGATWSGETHTAPGAGGFGRRVIRAPSGALLMCTSEDQLVLWRAEVGGGPFQKVYEDLAFGSEPCAGLGTQGTLAYLNAGGFAATSTDDGKTWTSIGTWR